MAKTPDSQCPKCRSKEINMRYIYGHGRAYACTACGNLWGWYYDRNKPENRFKSDPDS